MSNRYYSELIKIINGILEGKYEKNYLEECLIDTFDCVKIYDSEDELLTDAFFTLTHYASGEEDIDEKEWRFLLDCLLGTREYSINEKMHITTNPPHRQD